MSLAKNLWQTDHDLAMACLQHPFVQGLGDGSLDPAKFSYYVGQDSFFLQAFARAYSLAAAKAPNWEVFEIFHQLADGVLEELRLHGNYAQGWGVDLRQVQPASATRQYTDFLLSTAWTHGVATTAVAMAPCMRLYAFLGQSLATTPTPQHPYRDWVDTYSSDQFELLAQRLECLIDDYGTDSELIRQTYRYAMTCELDFFAAAWRGKAAG